MLSNATVFLLLLFVVLSIQQNVNPNATINSISTLIVPVLNRACFVAVTEVYDVNWNYPSNEFTRPVDDIVHGYNGNLGIDFEVTSITPGVSILSHKFTRDSDNKRSLLKFTFANSSNNVPLTSLTFKYFWEAKSFIYSDNAGAVNQLQYSYRLNTSLPVVNTTIRLYWNDLSADTFKYSQLSQYLTTPATGGWVIAQRGNLTSSDWWAPRLTFPVRVSQCSSNPLTPTIIGITAGLGGSALLIFVVTVIAATWYEILKFKKTRAADRRRREEIEAEERKILSESQ